MSDNGQSRRQFLQRSGGCVLLKLGVFGLDAPLAALPRVSVAGLQQGHEQRYPMPTGDGVSIDMKAQVILVRYQGEVFALSLACPHEHAAVKWVEQAKRFQCTKHNSRYEPDGKYTSGRATRNLDRFPVRLDGTAVVVDVTRVWQADKNPSEWAAAQIGV